MSWAQVVRARETQCQHVDIQNQIICNKFHEPFFAKRWNLCDVHVSRSTQMEKNSVTWFKWIKFQSHSNYFVLRSVEVQLDHLYFLGSTLAWTPRIIAKLNEHFGQFVSIEDWANIRIQQSILKLRCLHRKSALALLVLLVNCNFSFYT